MARNIVAVAHQYLGVPYVYGGTNPRSGLDCSAFLQLVYRDMGVHLGRTTYQQYRQGRSVSLNQLRPGDAVFIEPSAQGPGHVGMYIGHGMVQQSPHTGTRNSIISLKAFTAGGFVGARRYMNNAGSALPEAMAQPTTNGIGGTVDIRPEMMGLISRVIENNTRAQNLQMPQMTPAPVQRALPGSQVTIGGVGL